MLCEDKIKRTQCCKRKKKANRIADYLGHHSLQAFSINENDVVTFFQLWVLIYRHYVEKEINDLG